MSNRFSPMRGLRNLSHDLFRRPLYALALALLLCSGAGMIAVAAAIPESVTREVLINIGATVIGVVLTAIALEPLIERSRRPDELIHVGFPHEVFMRGVSTANHTVRIMGAWPYVMEAPWRNRFLAACRRSLTNFATIRILVLDPLSHAAEQRQSDLDNQVDVSLFISDTLIALFEFKQELPTDAASRLEVRVYSSLPPARLYGWDARAICSFFPMGSSSGTEVKHYDTNVTSGLARYVDHQFELVWSDSESRPLEDFLEMSVIVPSTGQRHVVQYVRTHDLWVAASTDLADDLFRNAPNGDDTLMIVGRGPGEPVTVPVRFRVVEDRDPSVADISHLFARKYGPRSVLGSGFRGVMHLLPLSD